LLFSNFFSSFVRLWRLGGFKFLKTLWFSGAFKVNADALVTERYALRRSTLPNYTIPMASDAHAHPWDLLQRLPDAEAERRGLGIACAASAWNREQFEYHENLARMAGTAPAGPVPGGGASAGDPPPVGPPRVPPVVLCFAVHPQLPASFPGDSREETGRSLTLLEALAAEGRLHAVGETGFDLYNGAYRDSEALQDELFAVHLELALRYGLPLVLHIRRAMHKVFAHAQGLKRLPAVVFHSYQGTAGEGEALLRRGINVFFSFGTPIILNHKEAIRVCAGLPPDRLLLETDAPYQPLRGASFSRWADLAAVLRGAAAIRREAGNIGGTEAELEALVDRNFFRAFGLKQNVP
jgi:TatD DNase family protein